jgi:serpin B
MLGFTVVGAVIAVVILTLTRSGVGRASYPPDPKVAAANNRFGIDVFHQLVTKDAGKNVFISPTSVALALEMTYNGSRGETKKAMMEALHLEGMEFEQLNRGASGLAASLEKADPKVKLTIANSIWTNDDVRPQFREDMGRYYEAEFGPLDVDAINAWVKRETGGKIERIVENLDPEDFLVLVNAVYFKGRWAREFEARDTRDGEFILADGTRKTVPMMHQRGEHESLERDGFQAVRLPYGDGRLAMYIFLPNEDSSLDAFVKTLSADKLEEWASGFEEEEVPIAIPRFKIEYGVKLNEALKALGMGIAFAPSADFSGMAGGWIGEVRHKTFVEVNEEGTEAAAATSVMMAQAIMPTREFIANRPFFCMIRDDETGAVVFMGAVRDPS